MEYYNLDNVKEFPPVRLTKELNDKNNSKKEQDTNYFVWKDDMTIDDDKKSASSGKAHSKGVLAYDKQSGFLLVHSLPRFPYRTADSLTFLEDLPDNTGIYAQSFLCVTLNKDEAVKTIDQLLIINPQLIMKHAISDDFVDKPANAKVLKFLKNRGDSKLLDLDIYEVSSKNNQLFTIFSKSKDYGSLPYDTMIPKYYKQAFYVETWTKPDRLAPLCTAAATVNNVLTVKFGNFEYGCNNEHSKWACSPSVVCIGDLNRTGSQTKRGGLTVCITNKVMAKAFNAAILTSEKCENNKEKTMRFLEEEQN